MICFYFVTICKLILNRKCIPSYYRIWFNIIKTTIARYIFYVLILDFSLEALDQVHRIYEAEESFEIIYLLVSGRLNITLGVIQVFLGTIVPLIAIGLFQFYKPNIKIRKVVYFIVGLLILIGVFFMRWNVVIGGQLFSKSFYGFTSFKLHLRTDSMRAASTTHGGSKSRARVAPVSSVTVVEDNGSGEPPIVGTEGLPKSQRPHNPASSTSHIP